MENLNANTQKYKCVLITDELYICVFVYVQMQILANG